MGSNRRAFKSTSHIFFFLVMDLEDLSEGSIHLLLKSKDGMPFTLVNLFQLTRALDNITGNHPGQSHTF